MEDLLQIQEKVRQFIVKTSYAEDEQINNDTLIFEQGIMDSMGFMSLITFIEESYSIQANDDELLEANFESIDAIAGFVKKKLDLN
ncbi:MAG: acyl carrier protein [Bacteroidota bacterium]|nr:acyl carrier protein [Bacteroidota bacterium]